MEVTHLGFDEHDNLLIEGINEKGKRDHTYIAIPPASDEMRVDIINFRNFSQGYNFDCGEEVIIIAVSNSGNYFLSWPKEIIIKDRINKAGVSPLAYIQSKG